MVMEESILKTVKQLIGVPVETTDFDLDLIIHINSVFAVLNQLGIGPSEGFEITGDTEVWSSFTDSKKLAGIKSYMVMKIKLMFDPPQNAATIESYKELVREFEFRSHIEGDKEENQNG